MSSSSPSSSSARFTFTVIQRGKGFGDGQTNGNSVRRERLGRWARRRDSAENPRGSSGAAVLTPAPWLRTKGGCVPHLTPDTLHRLFLLTSGNFCGLLFPAGYHLSSANTLIDFGKGVRKFAGLSSFDLAALVVPDDPGAQKKVPAAGKANYPVKKDQVSLWDAVGNRMTVGAEAYFRTAVRAMRPDAVVALCDPGVVVDSSPKASMKAVSKSLQCLDDFLKVKKSQGRNDCNVDDDDDDVAVFGAVEGGLDPGSRRASAKGLAAKMAALDGIILDGFHGGGASSLKVDVETQVVPIFLKEVLPYLRRSPGSDDDNVDDDVALDLPVAYLGPCHPRAVVDLVRAGVDMFDTSYCDWATDNGLALTFLGRKSPDNRIDEELLIRLKQDRFKEDFSPILDGCECYTCQKGHTRAYINHLLLTNELLAPVLLALHNLHHYSLFFKAIRESIRDDTFADLVRRVHSLDSDHAKFLAEDA